MSVSSIDSNFKSNLNYEIVHTKNNAGKDRLSLRIKIAEDPKVFEFPIKETRANYGEAINARSKWQELKLVDKGEEKKLFIDIEAVAKEVGITRESVKDACAKGELADLILIEKQLNDLHNNIEDLVSEKKEERTEVPQPAQVATPALTRGQQKASQIIKEIPVLQGKEVELAKLCRSIDRSRAKWRREKKDLYMCNPEAPAYVHYVAATDTCYLVFKNKHLNDSATLGAGGEAIVKIAYDNDKDCRVVMRTPISEMGLENMKKQDLAIRNFLLQEHEGIAGMSAVTGNRGSIKLEGIKHRLEKKPREAMKEYSRGDLEAVMQGPILDPIKKRMIGQLLHGLHATYEAGIIHRDIKVQNILVDKDYNVGLADFTLACRDNNFEARKAFRGTPNEFSPEYALAVRQLAQARNQLAHLPQVLASYENQLGYCVTHALDVWELGVVLYTIHYGEKPSWVPRFVVNEDTFFKAIDGIIALYNQKDAFPEPNKAADPIGHLIWRMLAIDPKARIGKGEVWPEFQQLSGLINTQNS